MAFKITMFVSALMLALGLSLKARAAEGTRFIQAKTGKEVSKFEAMKLLLESNNKEVIEKCQEVYIDERRGTIKNK